jgi:cell division septation protein DedD
MGNIQKHLGDLLYEHDCVIIPDFGGFVAHRISATLNSQTHTLRPPSKQITFNARLFRNDGVLAQELFMRDGISYAQAMDRIVAEVAWLRRQLDAGKPVAFDGVGVLFKDKEGQIGFTPSNERNYLKASFGWSSLTLHPAGDQFAAKAADDAVVPVTKASQEAEKESTAEVTETVSLRRSLRNLAAAAAIPFLIATAWIVQDVADGETSFSLVPASTEMTVKSPYQPRIAEEDIEFEAPETTNIVEQQRAERPGVNAFRYDFENDALSPDGVLLKLGTDAATSGASPSDASEVTTAAAKPASMDLYFIVGGAFREIENAEAYVDDLRSKGYDAGIFERKGDLHLVSFGSFTSRASARKALKEVRESDNPNAWLKRKR